MAVQSRLEKKQVDRIEAKLWEESKKLNQYLIQEKRLLSEVARFEKALTHGRTSMAELERSMEVVQERFQSEQEELKVLSALADRIETVLGNYLVALYKYKRRESAGILVDLKGFSQFLRRIQYARAIMKKDRDALYKLTERVIFFKSQIKNKQEAIKKTRQDIEEKELKVSGLQKEIEANVHQLMKIHEEKEFYETSVQELRNATRELKRSLREKDDHLLYSFDPKLGFETYKGKLPLPLKGGRFVKDRRDTPDAGGIIIEGNQELGVRSVFPGKVAFSGSLKGYGEVVIVDHGMRFFTVSAHLSQREKSTGDAVKAGEILGWVAQNKSQNGARLYFEVRKADRKLDPLVWLKRP